MLRETLAALEGRVVVDLSRVSLLDSRGIGVLAGQRNRLAKDGGEVVLRGPEGMVRNALETVGLSDRIE